MKRDEFLKQVKSVAQLDSRQEAERVTRATFEIVAEITKSYLPSRTYPNG